MLKMGSNLALHAYPKHFIHGVISPVFTLVLNVTNKQFSDSKNHIFWLQNKECSQGKTVLQTADSIKADTKPKFLKILIF